MSWKRSNPSRSRLGHRSAIRGSLRSRLATAWPNSRIRSSRSSVVIAGPLINRWIWERHPVARHIRAEFATGIVDPLVIAIALNDIPVAFAAWELDPSQDEAA